jgi:hypothetical protein
MLESKDTMATLKEGGLANITSSDGAVCTGCPTCSFEMHNSILLYFFKTDCAVTVFGRKDVILITRTVKIGE